MGNTILRAKFNVTSYGEWKKVFDADPFDRAGNGVQAYAITQPVDDPNFVILDLKFNDLASAQAFNSKMTGGVPQVGEGVVKDFKTHILNKVEYKELAPKSAAQGAAGK